MAHVTQLVGGGVGIQSQAGVCASSSMPGTRSVEAPCWVWSVHEGSDRHTEELPQSPVTEAW